jgi:hypothetical protein
MRPTGFFMAEKSAVTAACQHLIDDFLKPSFLPTIRPTWFNYPVDILGKWRGTKYRFIQRYRSGFSENLGEEFDAPFARLDWISRDRFDLRWHRHTGDWTSPAPKRSTSSSQTACSILVEQKPSYPAVLAGWTHLNRPKAGRTS